MSMYIGEALTGEGNEIAHIDLLIGDKDGPVGAKVTRTCWPC
jgi:5,6,7,8-tetrahydromethanopterin hydro-lyase